MSGFDFVVKIWAMLKTLLAPKPVGYEKLAIADLARSLTPAKYGSARRAIVQVENADIRVRVDGVAPTPTEGMLYEEGDTFELESHEEIVNFKAIRITSTNASIYVDYKE